MDININDCYKILELNNDASKEEIKRAYHRLSLKYHPDKCKGSADVFININRAYQILSNSDIKRNNFNFNELLKIIINNLINFSKSKITESCKKESNLVLTINVTLDEIYKGNIKKIVVKVKRCNNKEEKITLYISLINYNRKIIFENIGDENINGDKNDIEIIINIIQDEKYSIDTYFNAFDICYFDQPLSLYQFYNGIDIDLDYLNQEKININHKFNNIEELYIKISNKGLMYNISDEIMRGDLYIYYKLKLPKRECISQDVLKNFIEIYFK
jgi:DnaJ-class molecular chaperone